MATVKRIRVGEGIARRLEEIARHLDKPAAVRVGFLEGATYPDGTPVALVAAVNNYGSAAQGIPPRPFFSNMVRDKSPEWPAAIEKLLVDNDYDTDKVLRLIGTGVADQLRQAIVDFEGVPLKPATIARKGHAKQLVDTGHMLNSVDFEVVE